ncbi:hypothetical protein ACFXKF_36660 [Streptomyces scopuliridis]|uniref:hypothetical protein n=1 Tax=Streptomyces scopuliridis TaxID=452529 RepID=UPI0036D145DC
MIKQAPALASTPRKPVPQVWLLEGGEDNEGGDVHGVYAGHNLAMAIDDFLDRTRGLGVCGPDESVIRVGQDGSLRAHNGCDWLTLRLYDLIG